MKQVCFGVDIGGTTVKLGLVSREGEIPFANFLRIDNSKLSPETVAELIREHFDL